MLHTIALIFATTSLAHASPITLAERHAGLTAIATQRLADFDRELDLALKENRPGLLRRSLAYRDLRAARVLLHETTEELDRTNPGWVPSEAPTLEPDPFLELELAELAKSMDDAEADALQIRPGTGPEGNLTGRTFPTGTWSLTYDDGPSTKHTLNILEILEAKKIRATFFWLAQNVEKLPAVVDTIRLAGHALANHSFTHANLPKATTQQLRREIADSTVTETEAYQARPAYFRLPYGAGTSNATIRRMIAEEEMVHVFWTVDSLDWQDKDPDSILARVKKQMELEKRGIILFHDIHSQTVSATRLLLADDAGKKARWVTIPEAVRELNDRKAP